MTTKRVLLGSALLFLLVGLAAGWLGSRGLVAKRELTAAQGDLTSARTALLDQRTDDANAAVTSAGRHTARARAMVEDPFFRAATHLPIFGTSVYVASQLATTADTLAGELLPQAIRSAESLNPQRLRGPDGGIDVALLQRVVPQLDAVASRLTALAAHTHRLPQANVAGVIDRPRQRFVGQLDQLNQVVTAAARAVDLAPALLGADRPRRYFVLIQQTSESRGTGGLPGGFAILVANHGRLSVAAQGTDADLHNGPIPVPPGVPQDYVDLYERQYGVFDIWQNVNVSPDLPVVARVVAARWQHQSGQHVDGVIALDALALADILRGSGPVDLGGRQIAPAQLPDYLAVGQYRDFAAFDRQAARKEKLTMVARAATARLVQGGGSTADLLRGLIDAVRSGHLRMASDDPALGPSLRAAHIDGALPGGTAPLAYPVLFNSTGGKLDYFLSRSVRYDAGPCTGARRRSTITVDLRDDAPTTGLPPYLTIKIDGTRQTVTYDAGVTLSVYGTRGAFLRKATLDGHPLPGRPRSADSPYLTGATEGGLPLWYLYLDVPRGHTRRLVLQLDEPVVRGAARVPVQPLARPLTAAAAVPTCG